MAQRAERPVILWFRQDLRLGDNPALVAAVATGRPVLPVYVLDDASAGDWALGGASRWWLHQSLKALDATLPGRLTLLSGSAEALILELVREVEAVGLFCNDGIEPWRLAQDRAIETVLREQGIDMHRSQTATLWEADSVLKADGTPYRVFTPFFRKACLKKADPPREPVPAPAAWRCVSCDAGQELDALGLMPKLAWYGGLERDWRPGERGAEQRLDEFLQAGLHGYREGRNRPDLRHVSRLSPHLHFGEISPQQVWHAVLPRLADAGMRELWQTGYMHNRVRMIVGSFLVKNLLLHWHAGESWFWDTLVDADLANNSASWQWIAGSGADAAPYFRIFNPVAQGRKFDPDGNYVRQFVPELAALDTAQIHAPWEAPAAERRSLDYPGPIVDLKESRERALAAFRGTALR
jgi:deoxyribodipyrimidine photo-lyase